jgi:predicted dehydrogenase
MTLMPQVAERALLAGKHVLLEKPVGPSVAEALQVLAAVRAQPRPPVWLLAENYRWVG